MAGDKIMYKIYFITYSGMTIPLYSNLNKEEAKITLKKLNNAARNRQQHVIKTGKGTWEHCEAEDIQIIDDYCGFLIISKEK